MRMSAQVWRTFSGHPEQVEAVWPQADSADDWGVGASLDVRVAQERCLGYSGAGAAPAAPATHPCAGPRLLSCVCPDQKGGIDLRPWVGGGSVGRELPVSTSPHGCLPTRAELHSGWPLDPLLTDPQRAFGRGLCSRWRFAKALLARPGLLSCERPAKALCPTTALPPLLASVLGSDCGLGAVSSWQPPWTPSTGCQGLRVGNASPWARL